MSTPRFTPPPSRPHVRVSKVEGRQFQFARFHNAYRHYRAKGLGKIDALKTAQQFHPELNRAYCLAQENHEQWALESLDAKTYTPEQLMGKLH